MKPNKNKLLKLKINDKITLLLICTILLNNMKESKVINLKELEIQQKIIKFEKYLDYFDADPSYFLVLANLKLQLNDPKGALEYMYQAIKLFPKNEFVYQKRAKILFKLKYFDGALLRYNQAIAINPQNELLYHKRGDLFIHLKNYVAAIDDFSKAIEINNSKDIYYFNRGIATGCLRKFENAITDFEKVLELNPLHPKAKEIIINLKKLSF